MIEKNKAYVPIAKIGTTYGVRGWLKIQAYTEFDASILDYQPWYVSQGEKNWTRMDLAEGRPHGQGFIVKFPAVHTPEEARLLTGKVIVVPRSQLPALNPDEYYWSDLEGLSVIGQGGEHLGKVIYLMETGSHDVLVIKGTKEFAVPYLPGKVVTKVDLSAQEIYINWDYI